jgi:hypothetical protein
LSYGNKRERRKIHAINYAGSPHVDVDAIDAEAAELAEKDPEQAERFFGNRMVYGAGTWLEGDLWDARAATARTVPAGTPVVAGFDGSDTDDWTADPAPDRGRLPVHPDVRPGPAAVHLEPGRARGQVPRLEVGRPGTRSSRPTSWSGPTWTRRAGRRRSTSWPSGTARRSSCAGRPTGSRRCTRRCCGCTPTSSRTARRSPTTATRSLTVHIRNARKLARAGQKYILGKPKQTQKIDGAMSATLCNEAAGDVTAAGLWPKPKVRRKVIVMR